MCSNVVTRGSTSTPSSASGVNSKRSVTAFHSATICSGA